MAAGYITGMKPSPTLYRSSLLLWGLLTASCHQESDARLYLRASQSSDHPTARELCRQIREPRLQASCFMDLARLHVRDQERDVTADCEAAAPSPWRNECHFFLAEGRASLNQWDEALSACKASDTLVVNCLMHLWALKSRELLSLTDTGPSADFAPAPGEPPSREKLDRAIPAFEQTLVWPERVGVLRDAKLDDRAWAQFFQIALGPLDPIDSEYCTPLEGKTRSRCLSGARVVLMSRINATLRELSEDGRSSVCARPSSTSQERLLVAQEEGIRYIPSPTLNDAAEFSLERACRQAERPAFDDPGPKGSPPADAPRNLSRPAR